MCFVLYETADTLFIGIFNHVNELYDARRGPSNYARDNSGWKRLLPLVNMRLD